MKKKILLVDDSNTVIMLHRMMLEDLGYSLVIARNGEEAIEKAVAEKPDAILMDLVMPKMDGIEACRILRTKPETRTTPIIVVTTKGDPVNMQKGYEAGCNDYVTKPFDAVSLMAKLRNHLGE